MCPRLGIDSWGLLWSHQMVGNHPSEGHKSSSCSRSCSWARGRGYIGSIGLGLPITGQDFMIQLECLHQCLGQHRVFLFSGLILQGQKPGKGRGLGIMLPRKPSLFSSSKSWTLGCLWLVLGKHPRLFPVGQENFGKLQACTNLAFIASVPLYHGKGQNSQWTRTEVH